MRDLLSRVEFEDHRPFEELPFRPFEFVELVAEIEPPPPFWIGMFSLALPLLSFLRIATSGLDVPSSEDFKRRLDFDGALADLDSCLVRRGMFWPTSLIK